MMLPKKPMEDMSVDELVAALSDPHWRIRNLYWITDKDGNAIKFRPWPEQEKFLANIWYRNVVPKARQRGFSTAIQITALDGCIFNNDYAAAVIAQDDQTATTIFEKKIKFAWDRMPEIVREMRPTKFNNKHELAWEHGSSFLVATSTRGSTLQFLHVSEYGQICLKDPAHANEIQEGAFPSAEQGIIVVESTVESPFGIFSDMVRRAEGIQQTGRKLTRKDYRLHFASWWDADEYEIDPEGIPISPKDHAYFWRLEGKIGREISLRKRAWYVITRESDFGGSDEKMWRQYPSTLEEAFTISSEGLWLSQQVAKMRREKRICPVPVSDGVPVNTFWDLRDNKVVWFHQSVGPWDHLVDFIETSGEPYSTVVRMMRERQSEFGYVWGKHYLPHDGNTKHEGAEQLKTPHDMLWDLGLRDIEIVPRIDHIINGIDLLRQDMANYRIDEARCAAGIKHLEGYSKVWNDRMGIWSENVMDNEHTHATDALRQKAQVAHLIRPKVHAGGTGKKRNRSGMAA